MWGDARLLTFAANALFALAALLAVSAAGHAVVRSPIFALKSIQITGQLAHVRRAQIVAALQGHVSGTFFTADLEGLRGRFESLPWVRRAEVRRHWPDRLVVRLEEHVALARWGRREDARLVNIQGELFSAVEDTELPLFAGPPGSEREVARRYAEFSSLLAPLGTTPRQLLLSDRLAWQVRMADGLVLELGRDAAREGVSRRLERFVEAYPRTLGLMNARLQHAEMRVDLRYPNGFALRVPGMDRMNQERAARQLAALQ